MALDPITLVPRLAQHAGSAGLADALVRLPSLEDARCGDAVGVTASASSMRDDIVVESLSLLVLSENGTALTPLALDDAFDLLMTDPAHAPRFTQAALRLALLFAGSVPTPRELFGTCDETDMVWHDSSAPDHGWDMRTMLVTRTVHALLDCLHADPSVIEPDDGPRSLIVLAPVQSGHDLLRAQADLPVALDLFSSWFSRDTGMPVTLVPDLSVLQGRKPGP